MSADTVYLQVIFNANGGTGAPSARSATQTGSYPMIVSITVPAVGEMSRAGFHCIGWSTNSKASSAEYPAESTFSHVFIEGEASAYEATLYAVWERNSYPVTYQHGTNGAGDTVVDYKKYGVNLTLRNALFTRDNYKQVGWAIADGGAQMYDFGATYTRNAALTLYPVWAKTNLTYVKVNGVWKEADVFIKTGGAWKKVTGAYVKVNGVWKPT